MVNDMWENGPSPRVKALAEDSVLLHMYDSQKVLKSTDWTEDFHLNLTFKYS